jgi:hypothetical protein
VARRRRCPEDRLTTVSATVQTSTARTSRRAPGPFLQAGGALTPPGSDRASRSRLQGRRCRCSVSQLRDRTWRICREVHITTRHEAAGEQEGFASAVASGDDLDDAFAWKEERRLSQALTLQYDKVIFILEPSEPAKASIGKYVTVFDYPDSRLAIRHNGVELAYRTFYKVGQVDQEAIADNKHLGAVLAVIRDEQLRRGSQRSNGPRRRDQRDARLFKVG